MSTDSSRRALGVRAHVRRTTGIGPVSRAPRRRGPHDTLKRASTPRDLARRVLAAVTLTAVLLPVPVHADDQILIEAAGLRPPVLRTTTAHRVNFVNRSGRYAHVEFLGEGAGHHVVSVPGEIWAIFHRPGRHEYVVHLEGRPRGELRGIVEVAQDPDERPGPPTCTGLTVMGNCIEL
jgi:hypothetical protein